MATTKNFYSSWQSVPNGGARYRLKLTLTVASQNVSANTSTIAYELRIEKDRSWSSGFYDYFADWGVSLNGVEVKHQENVQWPNAIWNGWSTWLITSGRYTVTHDTDGEKTIAVAADWSRAASGWSPGTMSFSGQSMDLPPIPRATVPTVSPSPAVVGGLVTIDLPRVVGTYTHDITWESGTDSGSVGTGLGDSTTWSVPDVMSEFPGETLAPITLTVVTKSGATTIGTNQVTFFAREAPPAPDLTPRAPGQQFDVRARLVTYADSTWEARTEVPADTIALVDPASATATGSVGMSLLNAQEFPDYSIVDIDIFDGFNWVFTNHRLVLSRVDGDDVDPVESTVFSGTEFIDYELGFAYLQGDHYWDGGTDHKAPTTPGDIMAYFIDALKDRGWGPRIDITFDAQKTSLGDPWANTSVSRTFTKGTPLSQVLAGLVDDGYVEYRVEYHSNKAWLVLLNPGTGSDYSAVGSSPVVNLGLAELKSAPRRGSVEKRLTRVVVAGDDDLQVAREREPFDPDVFGHMEGWVSASGVKKSAEANKIGDNALRDNAGATTERTFEYDAKDAAPQFFPYSIFRPGDWVLRPGDTENETDRIGQVTIDKQVDGISITVLTGDRILSGQATLAKRQSASTGGSIPGGSQLNPSPLDARIPSAPVIGTITSAGYWNADGAAKSEVTISWAEITEAVNGADIEVDLYEVYWKPTIGGDWAWKTSTSELSAVIPDWDPAFDVDFRVRGRSAAGVFGEFCEDESHTTLPPSVDILGPDLADLYTNGVGTIFAVWGGTLDGVAAPARLAYVVAEVAPYIEGETPVYTQKGTPITAAGAIVLDMGGSWGDYLVRLRGYDRLGNAGDVSAAQSITISDPHIDPPPPEPPTGLGSTAGAAWTSSGFLPQAWFDLAWTAPTLDVNGDPVGIVGYDIWGLKTGEANERFITSSPTNGARIPVGNGEEWTFTVRAASGYGAVSAPSDPITDTADATISAAAAPTAPTLDQYAGILRIKWAGGGMMPSIKYVYATISTAALGTYTRVGMPLNGPGEVVVTGLAPDEYWAKIVMVDELGQLSTSASAGPIDLLPITGVTIQTSELANTGIKMTSAALTAYDASGDPTFILDATTGEVWIAPYDAVFALGAPGEEAETGDPVTGIAISSESSSFNTFIHPSGVQIRNDQTPLSWWEADATDASLVNFFSPRAVVSQRLRVGDYEELREEKAVGSRVVTRYKGA